LLVQELAFGWIGASQDCPWPVLSQIAERPADEITAAGTKWSGNHFEVIDDKRSQNAQA